MPAATDHSDTVINGSDHISAKTLSHAWFTIWIRPRATVRCIVDSNPHRYVLQIAAMMGGCLSISLWLFYRCAPNGPFAHSSSLWCAVFGAAGAAIGIIALYFAGFFYRWVGRLLGGVANYAEIRAALAWSWVPMICGSVALAPFNYWMAEKLFAQWSKLPEHVEVFRTPGERAILSLLQLTSLLLQAWWYVIKAKCLAEVNRFSAWLGLATDLFGFIVTAIALMISLVGALVGVSALGALIYFVATGIVRVVS